MEKGSRDLARQTDRIVARLRECLVASMRICRCSLMVAPRLINISMKKSHIKPSTNEDRTRGRCPRANLVRSAVQGVLTLLRVAHPYVK